MAGLFDNMESEDKSRIVELRSLLKEYNRLYYVNNAPAVTDYEFDRLMRELQDLETQYPEMADPESPTQRVGSDLSKGFRQVAHKYPMLSLDNTYSEQEVVDFLRRVETLLGGERFEICCELKFDGLSISLIYHNGRLVQAVTRGDGVKGDDVTDNARRISNIPQVLEGTGWPSDFEIRGEVLMPWSSFERLNAEREAQEEPLFANPRNAASGTLKLQNPEIVGKRGLTSYLYYLLGDNLPANGHYENMHAAAGWGFQVSENMKLCSGIEEVMEFIRYWDTERKNLPVATDGIVLKVNSQNQQQRLGFKAKSPRWAIAYKFQAEKALTKLESVTYQVGRTGAVTPVANFEPVQLSGTVVRRATLNNQDFIEKLDLHIGDMVWVEKGGEIIPKITAVELSARGDSSCGEKVRFISHCPECGAPLVRYEGESAHYCTNTSGCAPQIKGRIEHFIGRKAMNIDGIGPETVDMFFQKGMIRDFTDLYGLKEKDISVLERMGNKSAENIVSNIANSISAPFEKVLFAMGLRFVGEVVAKNLARSFKSLDALESASYEQLVAVDEIGDKIAKSVLEYFADPVNREIVSKIKAIGLKTQVDSEIASGEGGRLQGKTIVISGVFSRHSREEYKDMIERNGGKNAGSISAKTSFVLAGDSMGPAKREKAESLGIPLINEDDFLNLLN